MIINDPIEMKCYLEEESLRSKPFVYGRLERGDLVRKSMGLSYEIDDTEAYRMLQGFKGDKLPYGAIFREMESSDGTQARILKMFDGKQAIPFSRAVKEGVGECLEKSVLVQLFAQKKWNSYLVTGALELDSEEFLTPHAFNLIFREGKIHLVDAENPLAFDRVSGEIKCPYIAPVVEINGDRIVVPGEWEQGRIYYLY